MYSMKDHFASFMSGMARTLDIGSTYTLIGRSSVNRSPAETDRHALSSDWANIGGDLSSAMTTFQTGGAADVEGEGS